MLDVDVVVGFYTCGLNVGPNHILGVSEALDSTILGVVNEVNHENVGVDEVVKGQDPCLNTKNISCVLDLFGKQLTGGSHGSSNVGIA